MFSMESARIVSGLAVRSGDGIFFPPDRNAREVEYWTAHCGCDVESWTQQGTGHALIAHMSMPTFTSKVVTWLGSKGLGPK